MTDSAVPSLGFWGNFAKVFTHVGSGAVAVALWASQHPEVLQAAIQIGEQVAAVQKK